MAGERPIVFTHEEYQDILRGIYNIEEWAPISEEPQIRSLMAFLVDSGVKLKSFDSKSGARILMENGANYSSTHLPEIENFIVKVAFPGESRHDNIYLDIGGKSGAFGRGTLLFSRDHSRAPGENYLREIANGSHDCTFVFGDHPRNELGEARFAINYKKRFDRSDHPVR